MKELILKIKEIKLGGFFKGGYIIFSITRRVDGREDEMGDYGVFEYDKSNIGVMEDIARKHKEDGYTLLGDWGKL